MVAIGLQLALPDRLVLQSRWLLPGLELAMLIGLIIASPVRFNRESIALRVASLTLTGLLSLAATHTRPDPPRPTAATTQS